MHQCGELCAFVLASFCGSKFWRGLLRFKLEHTYSVLFTSEPNRPSTYLQSEVANCIAHVIFRGRQNHAWHLSKGRSHTVGGFRVRHSWNGRRRGFRVELGGAVGTAGVGSLGGSGVAAAVVTDRKRRGFRMAAADRAKGRICKSGENPQLEFGCGVPATAARGRRVRPGIKSDGSSSASRA